MLGVKSLDYNNYYVAFKGNYRKGVHRLRSILENPTVAQEFAGNVGGVSVVLGWPIGHDDKNSAELLELLQASTVIDAATLTWLSQWYPDYATDADTLFGDLDRCQEMVNNALMFRAISACPVGMGKLVVTLSGGDCQLYQDINAVAASQTAMTAVTASPTAMAAIYASSTATAKYAAAAAGLNPADYDDMTAMAASQTAMTAVAASQTAMAAVAASSTAMTAVINSPTALNAVVSSSTAMAAVAASKTALSACRASSAAMAKLAASSTAISALAASSLVTKYNPSNGNSWVTGTVNGSGIFIKVISYQSSGNTVSLDSGSAQSINTNTNYAKAFQSKLAVYYVPYSVSGYGIYYIPC